MKARDIKAGDRYFVRYAYKTVKRVERKRDRRGNDVVSISFVEGGATRLLDDDLHLDRDNVLPT